MLSWGLCGCFCKLGVLSVGVLAIRALPNTYLYIYIYIHILCPLIVGKSPIANSKRD